MKRIIIFALLLVGFTTVKSQETQTRSVGSFSGVKVAEGIDVYLKKGSKESVRVEATGTKLENVLTEVSGAYLKVHMKDGNYRGRVNVKVYVTFVKVDKLSASSAGSIFSDGVMEADEMRMSASSAGSVEVTVKANLVEASASSAGEVTLKGSTKSLEADASSAGEVSAYDLEAVNVKAGASSGGSVKVSVQQELTARASSGGSVRYRGNPSKSNTNSSSGGSVKKAN